jgi:hypothetical protein
VLGFFVAACHLAKVRSQWHDADFITAPFLMTTVKLRRALRLTYLMAGAVVGVACTVVVTIRARGSLREAGVKA